MTDVGMLKRSHASRRKGGLTGAEVENKGARIESMKQNVGKADEEIKQAK